MHKLDPATRRDWIEEYRASPFGPHSPGMLRVLQLLRGGPMAGRPVAVCTVPYREWVIGVLPGRRGEPVQLEAEPVFHSLDQVLTAVFERRFTCVLARQATAQPGGGGGA